MAAQFEWRDEYCLGVKEIDNAHRQLFYIINQLLDHHEKDSEWVCQEGIRFFKVYALKHFAEEESYMASIGYEDLEQHKRVHEVFREGIFLALEQEVERAEYAPEAVDHFLGVCAGWLIGHTLTEDQAIVGRGTRRWNALLPDEEIEALHNAVTQQQLDMFHTECTMISDRYGGEKFGHGVYYRLVYGNKKDEKKYEVLMAFEEKLLINTIGKILGIAADHLDSMLLHASRFTVQHFVGRVMKSFPSLDAYRLKEENLLTYDEFHEIFLQSTPQASMLFDTGEGYFSYCTIAPHMLKVEVAKPIEANKAASQVKEYLKERESSQKDEKVKPKLLVVDDSLVIRENLRRLLGRDYDVSLANSGISAIRAITLEKPDLVILDYEMPICDGRQTLEMMRSEKEFADIPVIFLTVKSDPESVRSVMALKPEGYLLKQNNLDQIQEKIDAFFQQKAEE